MITFNVRQYDRFTQYYITYKRSNPNTTMSDMLRILGYKSVTFKFMNNPNCWEISEDDYTWFLLKWS